MLKKRNFIVDDKKASNNYTDVKKTYKKRIFSDDNSVEFIDVDKVVVKKDKSSSYILRDLSFVVKKNKITAILGSSGAGKTTIARIINGLDGYSDGKVFINGVLLTDKTQKSIRKKTAFVFQNFNLFPHLSVLDNITYSPINVLHKNRDEVVAIAKKMLKQFNLDRKADCLPCELSGGQKQRVAIIRALILNPNILIMDEPTASLDPELVYGVVSMIKTIKASGVTIVVITHDISFAKKIADDVIMIHGGKCIDSMNAKNFFNKTSKKHFYSQRFLQNF